MKHFRSIDGLRAWMAWWVVCQHVLQLSGIALIYDNIFIRVLTMGGLAVLVFVIISGFVVTNLLLQKPEPYGRYLTRRFFRIYPLYLIAIILALILRGAYFDTVLLAPWVPLASVERFYVEQSNIAAHLSLNALLLQGLVPNVLLPSASRAILAPAWSLSLEWQYYLIAPMLIAVFFRNGVVSHIVACLVCVAMIIGTYALGSADQWEYPAFLPLVVGFFLLGVATRVYLEGQGLRLLMMPALAIVINLLLFCANYTGEHLIIAIMPIIIWFLVIFYSSYSGSSPLLLLLTKVVGVLLSSRPIVNLGLWSYSTYLLHVPLFVVALWLLRQSDGPITTAGYATAMLAACAVLPFLSYLSYRFIEQSGMHWGAQLLVNGSSVWSRVSRQFRSS